MKKIYLTCSNNNEKREVSKGQFGFFFLKNILFIKFSKYLSKFIGIFLREAQQFSQLTPYEINILFSLIKSFRDDE